MALDSLQIKSVKEAEVAGKRVLVHVDFDVPLKDGEVADDFRIRVALPTIHLLRERGASSIVLISKLGRPDGKVVEELRMATVAKRLAELVDMNGLELKENLRFDPREEANDEEYAKGLASLGDLFVNEAFADSHRSHASIVGIPKYLPSYAGLRFMDEVEALSRALTPPKNSVAVIGGAKIETKLPLLQKLTPVYGKIFLGGALANDLLKSRGMPVGASLVSDAPVPTALAENAQLEQPLDLIVASDGGQRPSNTADVRLHEKIVDIGEKTAESWAQEVGRSEFVLWNGPLGVYEQGYVAGTDMVAKALVAAKCKAVIGGGDTAAALAKFAFDASRVFVSTAGGAMLQFLGDGTLPGIQALEQSPASPQLHN